jgi:hypothetical protein
MEDEMVGADIIRKEANPTGRLREAQVNVFLVGDHAPFLGKLGLPIMRESTGKKGRGYSELKEIKDPFNH